MSWPDHACVGHSHLGVVAVVVAVAIIVDGAIVAAAALSNHYNFWRFCSDLIEIVFYFWLDHSQVRNEPGTIWCQVADQDASLSASPGSPGAGHYCPSNHVKDTPTTDPCYFETFIKGTPRGSMGTTFKAEVHEPYKDYDIAMNLELAARIIAATTTTATDDTGMNLVARITVAGVCCCCFFAATTAASTANDIDVNSVTRTAP